MSRSGDECVVALCDQWFLDYGEEQWRKQCEEHVKKMDFFSDDTRRRFEIALGWLGQWACSRTYGLGTKLPWDEQYLIESLSDSTIYMAYYTVAHLLQGGDIYGSTVGPAGIKPEQLTRKVWDYIFLGTNYPSDCGIPEETLKKLRYEFEYWYPLNLRVSGKDLVTNHLTFALYNHLAIWPETKAPLSFRANGHILLNNEKMSKSTGNFLSLVDAVDKYSADGMRFGLADAGDSLEDANFTTDGADSAVLRLYTQVKWTEEILAAKDLREGPPTSFEDRVFTSLINKAIQETDKHYERTNFREALKSGFFDLQQARDNYRVAVGSQQNMNKQLITRFIEVQTLLLAPVCPHLAQYVWQLLGKTEVIQKARWPKSDEVDEVLLKQNDYLQKNAHEFRLRKEAYLKPKKGKTPQPPPPAPTKAVIQVAKGYPAWMQRTLNSLHPLFTKQAPGKVPEKKDIQQILGNDPDLKKNMQTAMAFADVVKDEFLISGMAALDLKMPFDEKILLDESLEFIRKSIGVQDLTVEYAENDDTAKGKPGKPFITFS